MHNPTPSLFPCEASTLQGVSNRAVTTTGSEERPTASPRATGGQLPPHNGTPNSIEAAKRTQPIMREQHRLMLAAYEARGGIGLTDNEGIALGIVHPNAWRPRRGELVAMGYLYTASNRQGSAVWVCSPAAPAAQGGGE